jgi:NAD(P)-dependent dehydrogenase (short-subunit alcohol dehydrogenase family)
MHITGATALVTGANRGLGRAFVRALHERGVKKVYAAVRNPAAVVDDTAVRLDLTDPASIEEAARVAGDVDLLINNAGNATGAHLLTGDLADVRLEMETHYFGTLNVVRAFAPVLARNGGGAVLNVLSARSWVTALGSDGYSAAKAAEWSMTNALRLALAEQGTLVTALHVGYMDTDMVKHLDAPKSDPAVVAATALDGIAAGAFEVLADEVSRGAKKALAADLTVLYPSLSAARAS